jgi:hypothetical protein
MEAHAASDDSAAGVVRRRDGRRKAGEAHSEDEDAGENVFAKEARRELKKKL